VIGSQPEKLRACIVSYSANLFGARLSNSGMQLLGFTERSDGVSAVP